MFDRQTKGGGRAWRWPTAALWTTLFVVLAIVGVQPWQLWAQGSRGDNDSAHGSPAGRVVRIVDGDTVVVRIVDQRLVTVRYIGVDTPETKRPGTGVQCYGHEATARNRRLVAGRE